MVVAAFITSAYWFTSSTSFANPAVTFARAMTDTFRWNLAKQRATVYWWTDRRCHCCGAARALVAQFNEKK